jgi:hypothetical protein
VQKLSMVFRFEDPAVFHQSGRLEAALDVRRAHREG